MKLSKLDEAIAHALKVADVKSDCWKKCNDISKSCHQCEYEHRQIANWLEKLKAYQEIGTVEELKKALEEIQQYRVIGFPPEYVKEMRNHNLLISQKLREYEAIGTIEEFKALKEKSKGTENTQSETNNENCCANCLHPDYYGGLEGFYCNAKKCYIRAEHYDCEKFKKA